MTNLIFMKHIIFHSELVSLTITTFFMKSSLTSTSLQPRKRKHFASHMKNLVNEKKLSIDSINLSILINVVRSIDKLKKRRKKRSAYSPPCAMRALAVLSVLQSRTLLPTGLCQTHWKNLSFSFVSREKEFIEDFPVRKNEARKFKILALCFRHLQLKGEASLGFSHATNEDRDELKSQPRHWISVDRKLQDQLGYYIN